MRYWLIFLLFLFAARYVLPVLLRWLLGGFVRRQVRKMQEQAGALPTGGAPGEVRVEYVPPRSGAGPAAQAGEYVEFEEVK